MMKKLTTTILASVTATLLLAPVVLAAPATSAATSTDASTSTTLTTAQQVRLADIKAKGDAEISRRLNSLNQLNSKITASAHLSADNKTALSAEVSSEISGLNTLKTQLDAATTVADAATAAKSIFSDYRVYALVLPKAWLVSTADAQQTAEAKLSAVATKLQTRITAAKTAGKDVAAVQSQLDALVAQITAAQTISTAAEQKVLPLQPTDYNSDHTILSGELAQLQQAHTDNQASYAAAKNLVAAVKAL